MKTSSFIKPVALLIMLAIGSATPLFSQEAEQVFQKGLIKEEGEGSLQEAIDIYNVVVDNASAARSLRAKALLHVGICYEKLGQDKAKKTYEKLITDFADQEEIAAIGKKKLSYLNQGIKGSESDELIIRQVWSPAGDVYGVSPDGRYLNYIDWDAIELAVRDIHTGKSWGLTTKGTWNTPSQWPDKSIWSPDSKKIAYYWTIGEIDELHIVNLDGSEDHIICDGKGIVTPLPVAWSSDGKYILGFRSVVDETNPEKINHQVVSVTVSDGSIRVIKTLDGQQSTCCGSFSPDNRYIAFALQQGPGSDQNDIFIFPIDGSSQERIVANPADDKNPLWNPDGSGIVFLSDRNGTRDIWTLQLKDGIPQGKPELGMSGSGDIKFLGVTDTQSLYYTSSSQKIEVFTAKLDFSSGEILSESEKISRMGYDMNVQPIRSPDGRYIAYLAGSGQSQKMIFIIHDTKTSTDRKLESNLSGLLGVHNSQPQWGPDGKYLMVSGRTDDKLQGFFRMDVLTGKHTPILVEEMKSGIESGPKVYFPIFSKDGEDIFYLSQDRKTMIKRNIASKKERNILTGENAILHHYNLSPDGSMIVFQYNDRKELYVVSATGGEIKKIVGSQDNNRPYHIGWTSDNEYVIFIKAKGGFPFDTESTEIWRVPVKGGSPEHVLLLKDLFPHGEVWNIEVHPDGQHIVFSSVVGLNGVWALENLFND